MSSSCWLTSRWGRLPRGETAALIDAGPQVNEIESGRLPIDRLVTEFAFAHLGEALDGMGPGSLIKRVLLMPDPQRR